MKRDKRCEREAKVAAREVFALAGWEVCGEEDGSKHKVLVVKQPGGRVVRFPIAGTPSHGVKGGVCLAVWNARRLTRQTTGVA